MGSSVSRTRNDISQTSINNILQSSRATCFANCSQDITHINLNIDNGSRMGDIKITQECTSTSMCTMKTNLESIAVQVLESYQLAESNSQAVWFTFNRSYAANTVDQVLSNTITQIINSACRANAQQSISNVYVGVNNNSEVGMFEISQTAEANAQCTLENTGSVAVAQSASASQSASATAGSWLIFIILILAVVAIVLGMIYLNSKDKQQQGEIQVEELKAITQLGDPDLVKYYLNQRYGYELQQLQLEALEASKPSAIETLSQTASQAIEKV